jgi:hypothetical protein
MRRLPFNLMNAPKNTTVTSLSDRPIKTATAQSSETPTGDAHSPNAPTQRKADSNGASLETSSNASETSKTKPRNQWSARRSPPPTALEGENNIRMTKVQQKISGCFRSKGGTVISCGGRNYLTLRSKHQFPATEALTLLIQGKSPFFLPDPNVLTDSS